MNKKIICISIIGMFLLTSSATALSQLNTESTNTLLDEEDKVIDGRVIAPTADNVDWYPKTHQRILFGGSLISRLLPIESSIIQKNEIITPRVELPLISSEEITIEAAGMWIEGVGGQYDNDCNLEILDFPYWITIPHGGEIAVELIANWEIQNDQNNWLGEWEEVWDFQFSIQLPNGDWIDDSKEKHDILLIDDSEDGKFKVELTADSKYNGKKLWYNFWIYHYRRNWFTGGEWVVQGLVDFGYLLGFKMENEPPNEPQKPEGPTRVKINEENTYTTNKPVDPDGDSIVKYKWKFMPTILGNEPTEIITDTPEVTFTFTELDYTSSRKQRWNVKVCAQDEYGAWSEWSDWLEVTAIKSRSRSRLLLFDFGNRFPLLERLLNLLYLIN